MRITADLVLHLRVGDVQIAAPLHTISAVTVNVHRAPIEAEFDIAGQPESGLVMSIRFTVDSLDEIESLESLERYVRERRAAAERGPRPYATTPAPASDPLARPVDETRHDTSLLGLSAPPYEPDFEVRPPGRLRHPDPGPEGRPKSTTWPTPATGPEPTGMREPAGIREPTDGREPATGGPETARGPEPSSRPEPAALAAWPDTTSKPESRPEPPPPLTGPPLLGDVRDWVTLNPLDDTRALADGRLLVRFADPDGAARE